MLSETCSRTLKILDVERSQQVKDAAVPYILELEHLEDLNVFGTGLAVESKAKLLVGLKNLLHLRRGDFLCDALEHLAEHHNAVNLRLKLQNFWQVFQKLLRKHNSKISPLISPVSGFPS